MKAIENIFSVPLYIIYFSPVPFLLRAVFFVPGLIPLNPEDEVESVVEAEMQQQAEALQVWAGVGAAGWRVGWASYSAQ